MENNNLVRVDNAVVNNDFAAYQAAKLKRKRDTYIQSLEERINNLENCVKRLESLIEEIIK